MNSVAENIDSPKKSRLLYLDIARTIAIISISFNHAVNRTYDNYGNQHAQFLRNIEYPYQKPGHSHRKYRAAEIEQRYLAVIFADGQIQHGIQNLDQQHKTAVGRTSKRQRQISGKVGPCTKRDTNHKSNACCQQHTYIETGQNIFVLFIVNNIRQVP